MLQQIGKVGWTLLWLLPQNLEVATYQSYPMADIKDHTDDDGNIVMQLSEAKKNRWLKRIQNALFDDYENLEDGSYQGNINNDVVKIIQSNFPLGERMSEEELVESIGNTVKQVAAYIDEHTNGIHQLFITHFALDFVQQSIQSIFQIEETDAPNDFDPMYG